MHELCICSARLASTRVGLPADTDIGQARCRSRVINVSSNYVAVRVSLPHGAHSHNCSPLDVVPPVSATLIEALSAQAVGLRLSGGSSFPFPCLVAESLQPNVHVCSYSGIFLSLMSAGWVAARAATPSGCGDHVLHRQSGHASLRVRVREREREERRVRG